MGVDRLKVFRPTILHHNTRAINIPSILKHGLLPKEPVNRVNKKVFNRLGVYLSTERFGWMDWATDEGIYLGAVVTLDCANLELIEDSDVLVVSGRKGSIEDRTLADYICPHSILPKHIITIDIQRVHGQGFEERIISKELYKKHRINLNPRKA